MMGIYENFEEEFQIKKNEIIGTMDQIVQKGIHKDVERLDIIIFLGEYEIVNVIMYSMANKEEVFFKGENFSGSVNLSGPIFLKKEELIPNKEEENKIKARMMNSLTELFTEYADIIDKPMQLLFYKSPQAYNLKEKEWVSTMQAW